MTLCPGARHFTLLASGECLCTYCKSLWIRTSAKWLNVKCNVKISRSTGSSEVWGVGHDTLSPNVSSQVMSEHVMSRPWVWTQLELGWGADLFYPPMCCLSVASSGMPLIQKTSLVSTWLVSYCKVSLETRFKRFCMWRQKPLFWEQPRFRTRCPSKCWACTVQYTAPKQQ